MRISNIDANIIKMWRRFLSHGFVNIRTLFVTIFIIGGLLFAFITPPFQNPDEPMHFYRSYQLAKFDIFSASNQHGVYGGQIPLAMRSLVNDSGIDHKFDSSYKFNLSYSSLLSYRYGGQKVFEPFPNTAVYSPIVYVPSILAHQVTAYFHLPILVALYIARILSVIIVALAFMFALKYTPVGKWMFFTVGLIPMMLASSAGLSADAITIALSVMYISAVLKVALTDRKVSMRWMVLLTTLAVLISLAKQANIVLIALLFLPLLLNRSYRQSKVYIWLFSTILVSVSLFLLWYSKVNMININVSSLVQPDLQKMFIVHHPIKFIDVLLSTYFTGNADGFIVGLFGNFGWLTATLPMLFIVISVIILYLSTSVIGSRETDIGSLGKKKKYILMSLSLALFAGVVLLTSAAIYIYWSPYKYPFVAGIQGRYFLPTLPLLILPFVRGRIKNENKTKITIVVGAIIVIAASILITYGRFYN